MRSKATFSIRLYSGDNACAYGSVGTILCLVQQKQLSGFVHHAITAESDVQFCPA